MRNPSVFPRLLQWQRMAKVFALIPLIVLGVSCGRRPGGDFERMTEEFVYTTLSFSPAASTSVGLHEFDGKKLDGMLDDFSPPWLDRQKRYYEQFQSRL